MSSRCDRSQAIYEIRVQGELDSDWETYFGGLTITPARKGRRASVTTLTGPVADQAALRGVLCRLWDMNLTLILVRRIETDARREGS